MAKDKVQLNFDNFEDYKEKLGKSLDGELALFERFAEDIIRRASNHHQVSLNNLEESKQSLIELRDRVKQLKHSIFYHKETVIIDRQKIIKNTEKAVQTQNQAVLEFEYKDVKEQVLNFDYLNKALLQSAFDFFAEFRMYYAKDIIDLEEFYNYLEDKNKLFEKIIQKYEFEVIDSFNALDNEIRDMNDKISLLMQQKNFQLNKIYDFYQKETKSYLDNQLTFSVESDLNSQEIKDLVSDKLKQFKAFKSHLLEQEQKIKLILHGEYLALYDKVLNKLLQRKGNLLLQDPNFFDHIEESLTKLKEQIVFAKNENLGSLSGLIRTYNTAIKHQQLRAKCEKRAKTMTKNFLKMKKSIFFEYQKESRKLINQMEKYYKLYLDLLKVDPFLAQIIGDNATKIIKDEVNYLSTLKINKEHKINVNFDIKTLKLNQQINEIESKLIYEVERQIHLQDIDLLSNILDIQSFFVDKHADTALSRNHLQIEKNNIFKLEKAISSYLKYDLSINNVNRKYLNLITEILVNFTRDSEAHNIDLVESLSDIKLALKEYEITSVHFKNMFENEQRFLVMQSNRINDETKINNNFILTGYENQMRFAQDQIALANDEFRLRVQAIMTAVDEEREYYMNIIDNQEADLRKRQSDLMDEYQSKLYHYSFQLEESTNSKNSKNLEKELVKLKLKYDELFNKTEMTINENEISGNAKLRLKTLDDHLEEALIEAMNLRDETVDEMTELYNSTKEKYEYLKVYFEQKVNPLEPTFHQSLDRMKSRLQFKMKAAEIELDSKTKDLMENYINIYFQEQPGLDKEKIINKIDEIQAEKEIITTTYQQEIMEIEDNFQTTAAEINKEKEAIIQEARNLKAEILEKEESEIANKQLELQLLENRFNQQQDKKQISFENEIENLTEEYNSTLLQSKKYIFNLSQAFDKVLNTYKPYLKLTKNNRKIKNIVKKTNSQIKKNQRHEIKTLAKDLKKKQYLINE